jgi:hypothetical protein
MRIDNARVGGPLYLHDARRGATQHHLALRGAQVELFPHLHRPGYAHVEAIVAADHRPFGAHFGNDEFQDALGMRD